MPQGSLNSLYDPSFEHDSCGFGLIANIDGKASAWVVDQAFSTLAKMSHRGGIGADGITGDGCGILLYRPTGWLRALAREAGIDVGAHFASGHVFLDPKDAARAKAQQAALERELVERRLHGRRLARRAGRRDRLRADRRRPSAAHRPDLRQRACRRCWR